MQERRTVVGVFDDQDQAEKAIDELRRLGFTDDQIGFAARGESRSTETRRIGEGGEGDAGEGAATGALSGGVIGGLIGAAVSGLIPGIGPIIAGGILASVLGGTAVGAAAGGLFGALVSEGVPEEEARNYDEEFRGGRTIVTVRADSRYDEAQSTLRRFGANDLHIQDRGTTSTTSDTTSAGRARTASRGSASDTTSAGMAGMASRGSTSGTGTTGGTSDWNTLGPRYQQSWQQQSGQSNRHWEDVEPYYRYSHEMSRDPRYQSRDWNEVENDLRTGYGSWASSSGYKNDDSAWDSVKDSLRDAWNSLRGHEEDTTTNRTTPTARDRRTDHAEDRDRMELREERLDVEKRNVRAGEARIRKDVVEEEQSIDVPVRHEEVYIERRPVSGDRPASGDIGEDEIRIPINREVVDVEKETVVREEIELGKRSVQDTQRVSETVRREEASIETEGDVTVRGGGATGQTGQSTRRHEHRFDRSGRCEICGRSRDELAA